jgi:7-keto-8-aminopelargonate synthetase-like enzyme
VAAAYAALAQLAARPERLERLHDNARTVRSALAAEGFEVDEQGTQIVPLVVGDAAAATALCEAALRRGVFAQAIRPPTVPEGGSRLRLTVMATHREGELRRAADAIGESWREIQPSSPGAVLPIAA